MGGVIFGIKDYICGMFEFYMKYIGGLFSLFNVWIMFKGFEIIDLCVKV